MPPYITKKAGGERNHLQIDIPIMLTTSTNTCPYRDKLGACKNNSKVTSNE